jgi:hypothetical protein
MILSLPFKHLFFYKEKPVEIIFRIGTLEDLCEELKIEFWQITDYLKNSEFDFSYMLLYYGYLTACQRSHRKPKYSRDHAVIWYNYMSMEEKKKFLQMLTELFGKVSGSYKKKELTQE